MYTGIVCLVLFDARGSAVIEELCYYAVVVLALGLLAMKYMPGIFHRPTQIERLCEDLLHISTHASCVSALPAAQNLRYACALHCVCFLLQHRFLKGGLTVVHTLAAVWLVCAYLYGPRVSELKPFILAVACPHVLDTASRALVHFKKCMVLYFMDA